MNKRNTAKQQHWVPQFYLRYFATPHSRNSAQPQVWIFSKNHDDGDEKLTNIRNVCGQRYLYSPRHVGGERNWNLENKLTRLETVLGQVWPMLATDFVDLADESLRKILSLFIAITHLRNPEVRKGIEPLHQRLVQMFESLPTDTNGNPFVGSIEYKGREYELDTSNWNEYRNLGKDDHDRFFADFIRSDAIYFANLLRSKRWSIIFSETDLFITSDHPVSLHHMTSEKFGFGTNGVTIIFPLSPSRLLVMDDSHHEPENQYYPLLNGDVGPFNLNILQTANRFIITGRSVEEVLHEICLFADSFSNA